MPNGPTKEKLSEKQTIPHKGVWQTILESCPDPDINSVVQFVKDLPRNPEKVEEIKSKLNVEGNERFVEILTAVEEITGKKDL
ncbi:MAG TPA: hypothetical protein VF185_00810 [Patescibacteria group bacterium]